MRLGLLCLLGIFMISTISANLVIEPVALDATTRVGETTTFEITLKNTYDFPLKQVSFGNLTSYGFQIPDINLEANENKTYTFNLTTSESRHEILPITVSFKFPVDLPDEPQTHNVEITQDGLNQKYLIIREGDSVAWTNHDDISHQVYSVQFNYAVPVNQTIAHTFNQQGSVDYYDPEWIGWGQFEGTIQVLSATEEELAHNPSYDVLWNVNLNSILNPTNLTITNSNNNYTIEYGKVKNGLLTIQNDGNELAEIVHISSDSNWFTFDKNDLNIDKGDQLWVEYTITPNLFQTNQTDKTYNFNIKIQASNSIVYTLPITLYIPFREITGAIENDFDYAMWLENSFCPAHPCSVQCNPELPECRVGSNTTGIGNDEIALNVSASAIYELKKDSRKTNDALARLENAQKLTDEVINNKLPEMTDTLNQSLEYQKKAKDEENANRNMITILGFFVLISAGTISLIRIKAKRDNGEVKLFGPHNKKY